ncbi:MAG: T9SS type A sorting domain-containing protein, partial [Hymenobacteraceae bacterium]|nr:T9SS type A sorting domain-containing protein [Hymenobacteraceae bacterium]
TVAVALAGDQLNFNNSLTARVCKLAANTIPTVIGFSTATDLGRLQMQTATRSRIALSRGGGSSGGALLMTGGGGAWIDPVGPGNSPWLINAAHRATATVCVKTTTLPVGVPIRLSFNLKQLSTGTAGLFANVNFRVLVNGTVIGQPNYQPSALSPGSGAYQPLSFNITNFRNGSNNILVELQSSVNRDYTNGQGDVNLIDDLAVEVGVVVGLGAESAFAQGVGVFPNPSTGVFHVSLDHAGTRTYALRVTDLTGRVVRTQQVRAAGHADAALDLSALARGTYVLHVTDSDGNRVVRKLALE